MDLNIGKDWTFERIFFDIEYTVEILSIFKGTSDFSSDPKVINFPFEMINGSWLEKLDNNMLSKVILRWR